MWSLAGRPFISASRSLMRTKSRSRENMARPIGALSYSVSSSMRWRRLTSLISRRVAAISSRAARWSIRRALVSVRSRVCSATCRCRSALFCSRAAWLLRQASATTARVRLASDMNIRKNCSSWMAVSLPAMRTMRLAQIATRKTATAVALGPSKKASHSSGMNGSRNQKSPLTSRPNRATTRPPKSAAASNACQASGRPGEAGAGAGAGSGAGSAVSDPDGVAVPVPATQAASFCP